MPDIASLNARIAIDGIQQAKSDLRDIKIELGGAADAGKFMSGALDTLSQRVASFVSASAGEVTALRAKESSLAAMAARYVEASGALQAWITKNEENNAQALQQQANLDKMALGIQKEASALKDMTAAGGEVSGVGGSLKGVAGELSNILGLGGISGALMGGIGIGTIAAAGVALVNFGNETASSIAQVTNLSQRVGMGREDFVRFAEAADDASVSMRGTGVSYDQVGAALENFQNQVGRGQLALDGINIKGGAAKVAFEALGISLEDAAGQSRGMTDILMDTADAMQKMGDSAERSALARRLGLYELLPVLTQGRDGVRDMMGAVDDSLVPTAEAEKSAIRLKEAEDNLDDSMRGLKQTIGSELLPVLADLTGQSNLIIKSVQDFYNQAKNTKPGIDSLALSFRFWTSDLVANGRQLEENKTKFSGWSDAYAEGSGMAAAADRVAQQEKEELAKRIEAASNSYQEFGEWALKSADSELRGAEIAKAAAEAQKVAADATRERVAVQNELVSALSKPIPDLSTPRSKVEMAGKLASGQTTPEKLGADILGAAIGTAATNENWKQLVEIEKQAADGTISYVVALKQVIDLAPKAVDNKIAASVRDYNEALKAAGKDGSMISFYAEQTQKVQQFVKGTQVGAEEYANALAKMEEDQKKLARNTGATATWNATKSWPADQTPAKMEAERLAIEAQIKKDEETLARAKRVKEGYYVSVTEFGKLPDFADKTPSKGMVAHHDKMDPALIEDSRMTGAKTVTYAAQAITDNSHVIGEALQGAVMTAYNWTQTPDYAALWTKTGQGIDGALSDGIKQDGYRIRDAIANELTGIKAQLVRDVIDALRRGQ